MPEPALQCPQVHIPIAQSETGVMSSRAGMHPK